MINVRIAAVALSLATALTLTACSGSSSAPGTAPATAPTASCTETTTEEIYVQKVYECPDGVRVYTFADTEARDAYVKVASHFGAQLVEQGDLWARVRL